MKTIFKIIFSPILIVWWLTKLAIRIFALPAIIVWRILRAILPEITRPFDGLATALGQIFRLG